MSRSRLNLGDKAEKAAAQQLTEMGYLVERCKKTRFQPQDFFGCWDLIAIWTGKTSNSPIRFVQVSASPLYDRGVAYKRKLAEFPMVAGVSKEYWYYQGETIDHKPIFTIRHLGNGLRKPKDEEFLNAIKKPRRTE